jgi:hypothetical protein
MSGLAAVFLFNHRFEKNVAKLEAMYADRFSDRQYIMPFARAPGERVVPVYETSWNFSGHIAQAIPNLRHEGISHYAFIADDLILNPALNEHNLLDALSVGPRAGYIKSLASIEANRYRWWRALHERRRFDEQASGFDHFAELPDSREAEAKFQRLGIPTTPQGKRPWRRISLTLHRYARYRPWTTVRDFGGWARRKPSYPLLYGYSDFVVVPAEALERFGHYCGVLAAMNVFAEVAVPTALALACDEVVTELVLGEDFESRGRRNPQSRFQGVELWGLPEIQSFNAPLNGSLDRLVTEFPADWLYVHPVKLSGLK